MHDTQQHDNNIHDGIFNNPFHFTPLKAATNSPFSPPAPNFAFPLFPISYGYYYYFLRCIMLKWWICKPIISLPAQIKYQSSRSLEGSWSLRSLRARLRYSIEKGGNYKRAETARFCQKRFPPSNFLTLFRTLWRRWKGFFQLPPPPPVPSSTSSTFICSFISWATPLLGKFILSEFNDGFYYSIKAAISPIDHFRSTNIHTWLRGLH